MNYNKFLFFLLFNFSLCAALHAGMQDRAYNEVLIDNVTHPSLSNNYQVSISVGPEGRIYLVYESYEIYDSATDTNSGIIDGYVEVYSPEGALLATIDRSYISYLDPDYDDLDGAYSNEGPFMPRGVLPGPGGIFAIYDNNRGKFIVFDSNFQEYRTTNYISGIGGLEGWTRSLDDGFVTIYNNYVQIRDGNGTIIETENINDDYDNLISLKGYTLTINEYAGEDENQNSIYTPYDLTFNADGVLQSRNKSTGVVTNTSIRVIGNPYIKNGQVVVLRRAYRTKGDTNAIPVPSIVSVAQVPDTTLIDITYRVDDVDDATVTTGILASMTDGQGNTTRIPLATLSGGTAANLGTAVATNTDLTVTWDAGVDWGAAFGDVSFDVYANDGRPVLGFHMLTLPLPIGDLTISRSPVNDLEIKEALYYLWATDQGIRLDNGQLVGQGGVFEGVPLGTPEAPVTDTSTSMLFYLLGLEEASEAQVNAAREGFDANTVYQFAPKNPIRGDLLEDYSYWDYSSGSSQYKRFDSLPYAVNELGFDSSDRISSNNSLKWVVPATSLQVVGESLLISGAGGDVSFNVLDPSNAGWSISNLPDWLSASATSGVGDALITLSAATENADIDIRSATVDLNDGATSITVSQNSNIFPDNFADRYALTGDSGSVRINNINATLEPGEPVYSHDGKQGENSLWFTFTIPESSVVSEELLPYYELYISALWNGAYYSGNSLISFYTGDDLSTLTEIFWSDSDIYLGISPGQVYYIAITTLSDESGTRAGDIGLDYQLNIY